LHIKMSVSNKNIAMVDLKSQYLRLKPEIDQVIADVIDNSNFIKGPAVKNFENQLANYLRVKHVIGVANGTDALQIALMALDLKPGDEVIVPGFTYVATAEVIGLLGLIPIMVDVDIENFNISISNLEELITPKTKAIVPVHLFGQSAPMDEIMDFAFQHHLYVVEDNAQAIGSDYSHKNGKTSKTGTIGDIGCTSFFPSKNLGCFGDGGAIFTNNDNLAQKISMIANHGQSKKYIHDRIGVNSRLDGIQAAVLSVKLKELDDFVHRRNVVATAYNESFKDMIELVIPKTCIYSTHVFHQYTLRILNSKRDKLQQFLKDADIPSMIYYPIPLYKQVAFQDYYHGEGLINTALLCEQVLSLPIHTEMDNESLKYIISKVKEFFQYE